CAYRDLEIAPTGSCDTALCLSRSGDRSYRLMRHHPALLAIWRSLLQAHAPPPCAYRDLEIAPTGSRGIALCLSRSGDRAYRLMRIVRCGSDLQIAMFWPETASSRPGDRSHETRRQRRLIFL